MAFRDPGAASVAGALRFVASARLGASAPPLARISRAGCVEVHMKRALLVLAVAILGAGIVLGALGA